MKQRDYMDQMLDIDRTPVTILDQWVFLTLVFEHIVGSYITFNRLSDYVDYMKERYNVAIDNSPRSYQKTFSEYSTIFSLSVPPIDSSDSLGVCCNKDELKKYSAQILAGIPLYDMCLRKWEESKQ